jgi:predicted TIM-barrel fold metal-dependent hydrolase
MIIDFHIHIHPFPTETNGLAMPEDYRLEHIDRFARIGIPYDDQARVAVERMDAAGVDAAVVQNPYHSRESGHIRSNQTVYETIKDFPGRLYAFAGTYVRPEPDVAELKRAVKELGFKGMKIVPASQNVRVNDFDLLDPLYKTLIELDVPLLSHAGPTHFPGSNPAVCDLNLYFDVVKRYPELKFILAHLGSGAGNLDQVIEFANAGPNTYIEASTWPWQTTRDLMPPLTSVGTGRADPFLENAIYPPGGVRTPEIQAAWDKGLTAHAELIRDLVKKAPGRLIYGTDLPFIAKFDYIEMYKDALANQPEERDEVLGNRAARLMKIA